VSRAEIALIGAILQSPSLLNEIDLLPDEFLSENNQEIYTACVDLEKEGKPVDVITVSELLEQRTGRNWIPVCGELAMNCTGVSNALHYAKVVREFAQKQKAIEIAEGLTLAVNEEGQDAIDKAIRDLMQLNASKRDHTCHLKKALLTSVNNMDEIFNSDQDMPGISTGFIEVDECLGGFQNTDLYIIGARPAMGKTAMLLNMAEGANVTCGIISAEQGREQIGLRMISINGRVPAARLRTPKSLQDSDWAKINRSAGDMMNRECYLFDKPAPTITDVIRQARKWKFQNNIKILYVDYVQRIKATRRNIPKHEQVEEVVQGLKELARELEIPVVALAQVSRQVETRQERRPTMSDLKDSGSIEQEADNIMTLYRDEVYNKDSPDKGTAELTVLKNRHGPTGMFRLVWRAEYMKFENLDRGEWGAA